MTDRNTEPIAVERGVREGNELAVCRPIVHLQGLGRKHYSGQVEEIGTILDFTAVSGVRGGLPFLLRRGFLPLLAGRLRRLLTFPLSLTKRCSGRMCLISP